MVLSDRLTEDIRRADFDWLERYLGTPVPDGFKEIYRSGEVFELLNVIVDEEDPELYICINYFMPQNEVSYRSVWPGTEGRLRIACDHAGNEYHAIPGENLQNVHFFDHETGEMESLDVDIPTFIRKVRAWKDMET